MHAALTICTTIVISSGSIPSDYRTDVVLGVSVFDARTDFVDSAYD